MYKTDKSDRGIFLVRKMHCARRTERARPGSKHNKHRVAQDKEREAFENLKGARE